MGFSIMRFLDRVFNDNPPVSIQKEPLEDYILIFSTGEPVLEASLAGAGIPYLVILEPSIPPGMQPHALLALSDSDLDNLLLSSEAKHLNPNVFILAKCNDSLYREVFETLGTTIVYDKIPSAPTLLSILRQGGVI